MKTPIIQQSRNIMHTSPYPHLHLIFIDCNILCNKINLPNKQCAKRSVQMDLILPLKLINSKLIGINIFSTLFDQPLQQKREIVEHNNSLLGKGGETVRQ